MPSCLGNIPFFCVRLDQTEIFHVNVNALRFLIIDIIHFSTVSVYFKKKTRLQVKIRHSVASCKCVIYITSAVLCIRGQYSLYNYLYLETSQRMTHCFKCSLYQHIHFSLSLFICVFSRLFQSQINQPITESMAH